MRVSGRSLIYAGLLAAILVFSLSAAWNFSHVQQASSEADIAYNSVFWKVVSLQRETLRLRTVLQENIGKVRADESDLVLQFDLLWSRVGLLQEGPESALLRNDAELGPAIESIAARVGILDTKFLDVSFDDQEALNSLYPEVLGLEQEVHQFMVDVHLANNWTYSIRGEKLGSLRKTLFISFLGLLSSAGILLAMLMRQIRISRKLLQTTDETLVKSRLQAEELSEEVRLREEIEIELVQQKERAQVTLGSISDAVVTTDAAGMIEYLNPTAERLTGCPLDSVKGLSHEDVFHIVHERTGEHGENPIELCLRDQGVVGNMPNTAMLSRDGRTIPIESSVAPIRTEKGNMEGVVLVFHDISQSRELARELTHQAAHDALTGLINRREFEMRLQLALSKKIGGAGQHVVLYLDLDQFKVVNDTCGHGAGDQLLRQLTFLMSQLIRDTDTLARLGGDEFGVLLMGCPLEKGARVAESLRQAVQDFRFVWEGQLFRVGVSIGLVAVDPNEHDVASVLTAADVACYVAKDGGRNRIHVYEADDDELARRHGEMHWISRINHALENDRFRLYAQPIAAAGGDFGSNKHFEILLRMEDEDGNVVPPMAFLPAAERYDLISSIDMWVVGEVFSQLDHNPELRKHRFSINLSGQTMGDEYFPDLLISLFNKSPVDPGNICFEITETAAITNLVNAQKFISRMKQMGCLFALDDFGSGLSSFTYLKTLAVDYIKIDGAFVKDIMTDPADAVMVESMIQIGKVMELETIAEFVENDDISNRLHSMGVNYLQGYGIGKPAPLSTLLDVVG